ncbi:hypothetical protein PLESTB_001354900 [Pleodorina starrii]|uniref:Glycine zipper domain-containing protein n=1 Tax=Pleodorina starrii TaxID=330485 RepID=A0A9W6BUG3_9CHLO|nr:hypothetical protein PLESTM_001914700 [Pleodorina starrii]GLC58403.1 hypothetical protein PLESTB_001354900 [Pleodorina starrii]GLC76466.1 hypothetical protein PLESTF_001784300 [Pleodorina starrii]
MSSKGNNGFRDFVRDAGGALGGFAGGAVGGAAGTAVGSVVGSTAYGALWDAYQNNPQAKETLQYMNDHCH